MSTTTVPAALAGTRRAGRLAHFGPNWFTTVMGTGIVASVLATLPVGEGAARAALRSAAGGFWLLAATLLAAVGAATAVHWLRHPEAARAHLDHPVMAHAYGAPPMALLTVGAGAVLVGPDLVGARAAVLLDAGLWSAGTLLGLLAAVLVPRRVRAHRRAPGAAGPVELMPVVPPMVSAATGALLVPHVPGAAARQVLLGCCYVLFAVALVPSCVVIARLLAGLRRRAAGAPALWIVCGPLGQSVTAAGTLGAVAHLAVPDAVAGPLRAAALVYGLPVWGAALCWAAFALVTTARAVRAGLPFGVGWWALTFPVGTVVTGTSQLAVHSGSGALAVAAAAGAAVLVGAWVVVAARTVRGVLDGTLLAPVG